MHAYLSHGIQYAIHLRKHIINKIINILSPEYPYRCSIWQFLSLRRISILLCFVRTFNGKLNQMLSSK